jgi:hypothetical protein
VGVPVAGAQNQVVVRGDAGEGADAHRSLGQPVSAGQDAEEYVVEQRGGTQQEAARPRFAAGDPAPAESQQPPSKRR